VKTLFSYDIDKNFAEHFFLLYSNIANKVALNLLLIQTGGERDWGGDEDGTYPPALPKWEGGWSRDGCGNCP